MVFSFFRPIQATISSLFTPQHTFLFKKWATTKTGKQQQQQKKMRASNHWWGLEVKPCHAMPCAAGQLWKLREKQDTLQPENSAGLPAGCANGGRWVDGLGFFFWWFFGEMVPMDEISNIYVGLFNERHEETHSWREKSWVSVYGRICDVSFTRKFTKQPNLPTFPTRATHRRPVRHIARRAPIIEVLGEAAGQQENMDSIILLWATVDGLEGWQFMKIHLAS